MKKALIFSLAALVLMVMVFYTMPATALDFSFNGEYRIRAYAFDLDGTKDCDNAQTYYDQRFRLKMTAKANDNLKGVIQMLAPNNDKWGTGHMSYDKGNPWAGGVAYDLAYLEFTIPRANINCRIGKQYMSLGNYIVLGSYSTFDAIMLSSKIENVDLAMFTAKLDEGSTTNPRSEDDEDLYGLTLGFNMAPNVNIGVFGVYGNDGDIWDGYSAYTVMNSSLSSMVSGLSTPSRPIDEESYRDLDAYWLGVTANIQYAPVNMKFELDYSNLVVNSLIADDADYPDIKAKGYALFGDICADLEVAKAGIAALYTTGNKKDDASTLNFHQFTSISSRFSYNYNWDLMVINKYLEGLNGDQCVSNVTSYKLYAIKDLSPKTKGTLALLGYKYSKDPGIYDSDAHRYIGTKLGYEVDAILEHQLYDNLTVTGAGAYWFTDNETFPSAAVYDPYTYSYKLDDSSSDDNWLLKVGLLYKF